MESTLASTFGVDTPVDPLALRQVAAKAVLVYVVGLVLVRLGKGRLVGRISSLDIVVVLFSVPCSAAASRAMLRSAPRRYRLPPSLPLTGCSPG